MLDYPSPFSTAATPKPELSSAFHQSSHPYENSGYANVIHTTLFYLHDLKPCSGVTREAWLEDDLGLSDQEIGQTVYTLLYLTGHEYEPGLLNRPLRTVEDLIAYVYASPLLHPAKADTAHQPVPKASARYHAA